MIKQLLIIFSTLLLPSACMLRSGVKTRIKKRAQEEIKQSLGNQAPTYKLLGISDVDSAFGKNYYTKAEVQGIMLLMEKITQTIMHRTNNMETFNPDDQFVMNLAERQMVAIDSISRMTIQSEQKGAWSGWKVKVDYLALDRAGKEYRAERWMFFDKHGKQVEHSFELPLP